MRPYACTVCHLRFRRRVALSTHLRSHSENCVSDHECSACDTRASQRRAIHSCSRSSNVSDWKSNLTRHLKKNQCEPQLRSSRGHRSRQQSISGGRTLIADEMEQDDLEEKVVCKQCNESFRSVSELSRHSVTHEVLTKPFQCEFCDLRFNWKSNLRRHEKTQHTLTKPIPCGQCDRRFFTKRQLKRHMKSHSVVEDPPERKCLRSQKKTENSVITSPPRRDDEIGSDDLNDESKPEDGPDLLCESLPVKPLKTHTRMYRYDESSDDDQGVKLDDSSAIKSPYPYNESCDDDDLMMLISRNYRSVDQISKHETSDRIPTIAQLSNDQVFSRASDDDQMMNHIPQTDHTENTVANVKRRGRKRKPFALGKDPTLDNIKQELDDDYNDGDFMKSPEQRKRRRRCKENGYSNPCETVITISDDDDGGKQMNATSIPSNYDEDSDQDEGPFTPRQSAKTLTRMSLKRNGFEVDPDPERPVKKYPCSFCNRVFNRLSSHLQHERSHLRKPVFCNYCGKRFERQSVLDKHTLVHTSKKTYKCGYCLQGFMRKSTLQRHMEVHGFGEDPDDYQPLGSFLTTHGVDSPVAPMVTLEDTESDSDYYLDSRKITLQENSGSHTYNTRFASKLESCKSEVQSGQEDPDCTVNTEPADECQDSTQKSSYSKDSGVKEKAVSLENRDQQLSVDLESQERKTHSLHEESHEKNSNRIDEVSKSEVKDSPQVFQSEGKSLEAIKKPGDALTYHENDADVSQCAKHLMIIRLHSKNRNTFRFNKKNIEFKEIKNPKESCASVPLSETKQKEDLNQKVVAFSSSTLKKMEERDKSSVPEPMICSKDTNIQVAKNVSRGTGNMTEGLVGLNCSNSKEITNGISSDSSFKKRKETCENPVDDTSMNNKNIGISKSIPIDANNKNELPALKSGNSDGIDDEMQDSEIGAHQTLEKEAGENNIGATPDTVIENQGTKCIKTNAMSMKDVFEDLHSSNSSNVVSSEKNQKENCINLAGEDAGNFKQDEESILTDVRNVINEIIISILFEPENANNEFVDLNCKESEETTEMITDKVEKEGEKDKMEDEAEEDKMEDEAEEDKMVDEAEEDKMKDVIEEDKMEDEAEEDKMTDVIEEDKVEDVVEEDKVEDEAKEDKVEDEAKEDKVENEAEEEKDFNVCEDKAHKEMKPAHRTGSKPDVDKEDLNEFPETVLLETFKETTSNEDRAMTGSSFIDAKSDTDSGLELDQITPSLVQTVEEAKQNETIYDDLELVKFEEIQTEELKQVYEVEAIQKSCQDITLGNQGSPSVLIKPSQENEAKTYNTRDDFVPTENDGYCEIESVTPMLSLTETLDQRSDDVLGIELENLEKTRNSSDEINTDGKVLERNDQDENIIDDNQGEGSKQTGKENELQSITNLLTRNLVDDHDLISAGLPSNMIQCEEVSTTDSAMPEEDPSNQVAVTGKDMPTVVHEKNKGSDGKEIEFQTVQGPSKSKDESVRLPNPLLDENSKTESCALLQSDSFQSPSKKTPPDSPQVKNRKSEPPKKRGPKPGSSRKRKRRVPEVENLLNPFNNISIEDGDFQPQKKFLRSQSLSFDKVKEVDRFGSKNECVFNAIDTLSLPGIKQENQRFPNEYVGYESISIRQNITVEQFIEREDVDVPRNQGQFQFGPAVPPPDGFGTRGVVLKKDMQQMRSDRIQNPYYPFNFSPPSYTPLQNDPRINKNPLPPFNSLRDWMVPKTEEKEQVFPGFREIRNGMNPNIGPADRIAPGFNVPGIVRKQPERGFLGSSQQFECNKCDRSFKRKEDMIRHRFTEHEKNCF